MAPCSQENHLNFLEKLEDTNMLKKIHLLLTIFMITDIQTKMLWQHMISIFLNHSRITHKALKASKLKDIKN